ncbi:SipW-dependent-type signal peptide-containing protein [Virgibacillus phasianinus]|nr:SipW-dependent-type signal peptide-containing protein [Virgibacillus phasianinus]
MMNSTSSTNASFNDIEEVSGTITVGTWEMDKPDINGITFISQDGNCNEITAVIQNDMDANTTGESSLKYEVYKLENGKQLKVASGDIPQLKPSEEKELTFNTSGESGKYKFKVFQRSGEDELWGEPITVTCKDPSVEEEKTAPIKEDKQQTTAEKEDNQTDNGQTQETNQDKATPDSDQAADTEKESAKKDPDAESVNNEPAEKEDQPAEKQQDDIGKKTSGTDTDKK